MNDLQQIRDELLFIADGCLVPPDGGSPDIYDAMASAKRALIALDRMIETPAPQGWKLVPIEPTEEMSLTFRREWQDMDIRGKLRSEMFKAAYKAMLSAAPTPAPTEKVDYKQLKQLVFMWAADVNGAPLDSDICEIINIIRRTEKVDVESLKLEVEKCFPSMNYTESSLVDVVIDHLSNTGRLR